MKKIMVTVREKRMVQGNVSWSPRNDLGFPLVVDDLRKAKRETRAILGPRLPPHLKIMAINFTGDPKRPNIHVVLEPYEPTPAPRRPARF